MSVTLGTNLASMSAQRRLAVGADHLARTFERLSSGQRINRASDDAAGLAIADRLQADARVFAQGIRNLNDGISLLHIADDSLEQLSQITTRLAELAEQAATGSYSHVQRTALDREAQSLSQEFLRITQITSYNGRQIFGASFGELRLQGGYGSEGGIQSTLGGAIGTGTFGAGISSTISVAGAKLASGDLNGDGFVDVVTAGVVTGGGGFLVNLGIGDGSFASPVTYLMNGTTTTDVELADLNNDGVLDVVTAGGSLPGTVTFRLGNGDGTFGSVTTLTDVGPFNSSVVTGDLNGDGNIDIISLDTGGRTTVRLGDGSGSFSTVQTFDDISGGSPLGIELALGDLNGDGILDLVTSGYRAAQGRIYIRRGNGDGTFGSVLQYSDSVGGGFGSIAIGDINGDGINDLVLSSDYYSPLPGVRTYIGTGTGSFSVGVSMTVGAAGYSHAALADLNGDGILDLLAQTTANTNVYLGNGNGTFGSPLTLGTMGYAGIFADLNGDGALDIVSSGLVAHLNRTTSGVAPLLPFSLQTMADARQALPMLGRKRNQLAAQRGVIGAFQARVFSAASALSSASENFQAAESRIRAADLAQEAADLVRGTILQEAALAVLAQANQQPAIVVLLLSREDG